MQTLTGYIFHELDPLEKRALGLVIYLVHMTTIVHVLIGHLKAKKGSSGNEHFWGYVYSPNSFVCIMGNHENMSFTKKSRIGVKSGSKTVICCEQRVGA